MVLCSRANLESVQQPFNTRSSECWSSEILLNWLFTHVDKLHPLFFKLISPHQEMGCSRVSVKDGWHEIRMTDESSMSVIRITLQPQSNSKTVAVLICWVCDLGVVCWSRLTGCIYTAQIHLTCFRKWVPEYEYSGRCKYIMQRVREIQTLISSVLCLIID